jgi:hypothetical protein
MKQLKPITEDEMIAVFLSGELASERFGGDIHTQLKQTGKPVSIIAQPDITNQAHNAFRRQVLSATRGYEQRDGTFTGFPRDITWCRAELSKEELAAVKYIDYSYWVEITNGTRLPKDAVATIRAGKEIFNVSNERFLTAAEAVRQGTKFPTMILAGENGHSFVALEGHLRLTAYALAWDAVPDRLEVIIGLSPHMAEWGYY